MHGRPEEIAMRLYIVRFVAMLVFPLLVAPLVAGARQAKQVPRIGYLSLATVERDKSLVDAFRDGLRALGYVEGYTIVIEQRHAAERPERLPELAAELLRLPVDVLVVYGAWFPFVKELPSTTPIVFTVVSDPVSQGLVASLAHPGGNLTGLSDLHEALISKRLEFLKEVVPAASRVAVLWNPVTPGALLLLHAAQAAALALGLTILPVGVSGLVPDDIEPALATIAQERAEAILVIPDQTISTRSRRIVEFAVEHRLPTMGTVRGLAARGFLMSYGMNLHELWRRAATYVDKILKGAKPADLPVEQPMKFELVINLKTAQAEGLTIPPTLLFQADEVIK
jgi:putative ABC transport system substrate-binding protein